MSTGSAAPSASPTSASHDSDSVDRQKNRKPVRGSRQVKKLSAEQLARKRAHDREAQRNSRKRTIEHIDRLEKTVGDHVDYNRQLLVRNEQLELRLARLESQLDTKAGFASASGGLRVGIDGVDATLPRRPVSQNEVVGPSLSIWDSSSQDSSMAIHAPIYAPASTAATAMSIPTFEAGMVSGAPIYNPTPPTSYEEPAYSVLPKAVYDEDYDAQYYEQDNLGNSAALAPHFYMADSTAGQSSDLTPAYTNQPLTNPPTLDFVSSCWQRQPSVYAWQISTKLSNPDNPTDEILLSTIQAQRHEARTGNLCGEALVGPRTPSLNALFGRAGGEIAHPLVVTLTRGVLQLRQIITTAPNLIGGLLATYRLYQWMIEPTQETYNRLFEWQAPRPSQLVIAHPPWMDLPPWGKFRDRIIENQDLYDNLEFQLAYMANMTITWPHDPREMFCGGGDGQLWPSPLMEKYLGNIENLVMGKPFLERYPEFRGLCRVTEEAD